MACPMAPGALRARSRAARAANGAVRSGSRIRAIDRSAKASIWPGSRMRGMNDLAKPGPMMLPCPARCHGSPDHGVDGALDPDSRIDVNQNRADQYERAHRVHQRREPDHADREIEREIRAPYDNAGQHQAGQAQDDHEEQELLPGVIASHFRQALLAIVDHVAPLPQPLPVGSLQTVVIPHGRGEKHEHQRHDNPDEGVQDARPRTTAEQAAEPEQRRMKQREPRERGQHEGEREQPVIGAYPRGVANDGVAVFGIAHGRLSAAPAPGGGLRGCALSRAWRAAASSRSSTSFGPTRTKWKKPASAVSPITTSASGLVLPFHNLTNVLMCGSAASPAYSCGRSA